MQFKVSLLDKAISIPASYLALHRTPISSRQKWVRSKKCVRAGSESFTLQIKGDRLSLKLCIFPRCVLLNLNDFRKSLFLDVFLHFVMLMARGVDRVWPDFKKCILFIKALHVRRLLILRGVWARQRVFSFSAALLTPQSRLIGYEGNCSRRLSSIQPRGNCKGSVYDPGS